jgi:hypothetical protein
LPAAYSHMGVALPAGSGEVATRTRSLFED